MAQRDLVVIGASAGGIPALRELLGALPASLPAAVVVVIHLSPHAESYLESTLQAATALRVRTAADGMSIEHGVVYVPVPDRHLLVTPRGLRLTRAPRECRARPAIDPLFRSAAVAFGPRVTGVVLTGSLDDGTAGLWAVKDHGGAALVQDPSTAAFSSMPDSAARHVAVDCIGDLAGLAAEIARLATTEAPKAHPQTPSTDRHEIENEIALEANGLEAGALELGPPSTFSCPTCNGVLMGIEEGTFKRYRCHTGHAFSPRTLLADIDHTIDDTLWGGLRAIEQRILLLRQMADIAANSGSPGLARRYRTKADETEQRLEPVEALLREGRAVGDPAEDKAA